MPLARRARAGLPPSTLKLHIRLLGTLLPETLSLHLRRWSIRLSTPRRARAFPLAPCIWRHGSAALAVAWSVVTLLTVTLLLALWGANQRIERSH